MYSCTCANPAMSGGCDMCCSYGSDISRLGRAHMLRGAQRLLEQNRELVVDMGVEIEILRGKAGESSPWIAVDPPCDIGHWIRETNEPFSRAGMLCRMEDGELVLVGDVNLSGGQCECCAKRGRVVAYEEVYRGSPGQV